MNLFSQTKENIINKSVDAFKEIELLEIDDKVDVINNIKKLLHQLSPMKREPVDCIVWERGDKVFANDYNPNSVAPPEMKLLEVSILEDGYTQPIVTFDEGELKTVVDGFH